MSTSTDSPWRGIANARRPRSGTRSGFSLIEMMMVFAILIVALSMFSRTLSSTVNLDPLATETADASEAARNVIEQMRGFPFGEVYSRYNADPADDPGGPGTAPGPFFNVDGLSPTGAEGFVGQIVFADTAGAIREDATIEEFGLPRDLNGDGLIDTEDHKNDCIILPFKIRLEWLSRHGTRSFEMHTVFADL